MIRTDNDMRQTYAAIVLGLLVALIAVWFLLGPALLRSAKAAEEADQRYPGLSAVGIAAGKHRVPRRARGSSHPAGQASPSAGKPSRARLSPFDANGNGVVRSGKTGARARVSPRYSAAFQAYIDDLEQNHGARVYFMGGLRAGPCASYSLHPCGKALDVCQTARGRVAPKCRLPSRATLAKVAAAHGLFEGGRWCHSDYGHAQVGKTAGPCGRNLYAAVEDFHAKGRRRR